MALPFKNGYELADSFGLGDLYLQSKEKEQENEDMLEGVKKMFNKLEEIKKRGV